jgi:phosphoadenosine phosphosulfate reductase
MSVAFASEYPALERAALDALERAVEWHERVVFASSFGAEDMVILDLIAGARLPIATFTLDTGRLPQETHDLVDVARRRYDVPIEVVVPNAADIEAHVRLHGPNAFYDGKDLRVECCRIRKAAPLARALAGAGAWVTGLRREQNITRAGVEVDEHDALHGIAKVNPLAHWSNDDVWHYVRARDVPVNALHARGYPSVGCAPCTRAVAPGNDPRSGRWWWEAPESRECGLHRRPIAVKVASPAEASP